MYTYFLKWSWTLWFSLKEDFFTNGMTPVKEPNYEFMTEFYILLTVHLGIILVYDQLDAQFSFLICLFQSSTCFEQPHAHRRENQLYQYNFWYMSLCVIGRLVCRSGSSFPTCIHWNKHIRKENCASSWLFTGIIWQNLFRAISVSVDC
jgi:hypothetical protein